MGNRITSGAPADTYPCAPGGANDYVYILCTTPEMWTNLCNAIGRPEMASDERFRDRRSRLHHVEELTAAINAWTTRHTKHDVMRILGEADVPCGKVLDSVELLDDPHLRKRGMIVTVQHPVRGEFTMPGCPVKLEDSPVEVRRAPLLGEHNNEVFAQYLGFDATEIERLKQEGVI
jgi:formyl-CoA transferase